MLWSSLRRSHVLCCSSCRSDSGHLVPFLEGVPCRLAYFSEYRSLRDSGHRYIVFQDREVYHRVFACSAGHHMPVMGAIACIASTKEGCAEGSPNVNGSPKTGKVWSETSSFEPRVDEQQGLPGGGVVAMRVEVVHCCDGGDDGGSRNHALDGPSSEQSRLDQAGIGRCDDTAAAACTSRCTASQRCRLP